MWIEVDKRKIINDLLNGKIEEDKLDSIMSVDFNEQAMITIDDYGISCVVSDLKDDNVRYFVDDEFIKIDSELK